TRAADRALVVESAARAGCPLVFLECRADDETAASRLATRVASPETQTSGPAVSDADWQVRAMQSREHDEYAASEPHLVLDAVGAREAVVERALRLLWSWRRLH